VDRLSGDDDDQFFAMVDDEKKFYRKSPGRICSAGLLCGVSDVPDCKSLI
jgi:hypothetical protein